MVRVWFNHSKQSLTVPSFPRGDFFVYLGIHEAFYTSLFNFLPFW